MKLLQKRMAIILFMFLILAGIAYASVDILNINDNQLFPVTEDVNYQSWVYATDDDPIPDYPLNFTDTARSGSVKFNAFNLTNYNATHGLINFTPGNNDVGYYEFMIIVYDKDKQTDLVWVRYNVTNVNDPINLVGVSPNRTYISINENESINFTYNLNRSDIDVRNGDVITTRYLLNNVLNYSTTSVNPFWEYSAGYCLASRYTLELNATDAEGTSDKFTWDFEINNTNRKPKFNSTNPIDNLTVYEDNNLINNFSLEYVLYDLDYRQCNGVNKDSISYGASGNGDNITIVIDPVSYNVSFYPKADWFGNATIRIYLNDSNRMGYSNYFTLEVKNIPDVPVLDFIPEQTFSVQTLYVYDVNATDPDNEGLIFTSNDTRIPINESSGVISTTAARTDNGTFYVNITVKDPTGNMDSQIVIFNIMPNHLPVLDEIKDEIIINESQQSFIIWVNATDEDNDTLRFFDTTTLFDIEEIENFGFNATALINFTPSNSKVGNYVFNITVRDNISATDIEEINLTILNVDFPPTMEKISPQRVKAGYNYQYQVVADDDDIDIDGIEQLTFYNNQTDLFTINRSTGFINFTPGFDQNGTYYVEIMVNDTTDLNATQIVQFDVYINHAPILSPLPYSTVREDRSFTLLINASDQDRDNLTFAVNTTMFDIEWYNYTGNYTFGLISFTPTYLEIGEHSLNITANDTFGGVNFTHFYLNVTPFNDRPYFDPPLNNYSIWNNMREGKWYTITLDATDEEGDLVDFKLEFLVGDPIFQINYTDRVNADAVIIFKANESEIGNYSINVTINDSNNFTSEIVNFSIVDYDEPPVIYEYYPTDLTLSFIEDNKYVRFNITNASDPEGTALSYRWKDNNVSIGTGATLSYNRTYCTSGIHNISVIVTDQAGVSAIMNWSVNISNVNRPPKWINPFTGFITKEDRDLVDNFTMLSYFYDPDTSQCTGNNSDVLVFRIEPNSSAASLSVRSSGFVTSLIMGEDWYGSVRVNISVSDGYVKNYSNYFYINASPRPDPPVIWPIRNKTFYKGLHVHMVINATDPDGDVLSFSDNATFFNLTYNDIDSRNITFYVGESIPDKDYPIRINVTDGNATDEFIFIMEINSTNDPPIIQRIMPFGMPVSPVMINSWINTSYFPNETTHINITENVSLEFRQTTTDPDGDELTYRWYLDNHLNATTRWLNHSLGFKESNLKLIKYEVTDGIFTRDFTWNLSITNLNRPLEFGKYYQSGQLQFSSGTSQFNDTYFNTNENRIQLSKINATHYYQFGYYVSPVINFRYGGETHAELVNLSLTAEYPNPANVKIRVKGKMNHSIWSNWSDFQNGPVFNLSLVSFQIFNSSNNWTLNRTNIDHLRYMVQLSNPDTTKIGPYFKKSEIHYQIADFILNDTYESSEGAGVFNLNDYYYDLDGEDRAYGYNKFLNGPYLNISIARDGEVMMNPLEEWTGGKVVVSFWASDQFEFNSTTNTSVVEAGSKVYSNNVTITLVDVRTTGQQGQAQQNEESTEGGGGGGGGGGGISETPKEVPDDTPDTADEVTKEELETDVDTIEILVPGFPNMTTEHEIIVPLKVQNPGNVTLKGITLSASTDSGNVTFNFRKYYFNILEKDESEETELIINRYNPNKEIMVKIIAKVQEPILTDSLVIPIVTLLEKTKEEYRDVRDLLMTNPECLELNEQLEEASLMIDSREIEKARKIIDDVRAGCKFLITSKEQYENSPSIVSQETKSLYDTKMWATLGIAVLLLGIFIFVKRISDKKTLEIS